MNQIGGSLGEAAPSSRHLRTHSSARNGSKTPRTRRRDFGDGTNRYYYANNALSDIMATLSRAGDPRRVMSVITRGMLNLLVNRRRADQSSDERLVEISPKEN